MAKDKPKDEGADLVKMKAPKGSTGCSFDGIEYTAAKDGKDEFASVQVPAEAVGTLMSHGFEIA